MGLNIVWFLILIALFNSACSKQSNSKPKETLSEIPCVGVSDGTFFPDMVFGGRKDLHDFPISWYAKHLKAMEEPSIYSQCGQIDKTIFRFLWLRTFHNPVSLRLEIQKDGTGLLYVKMTDGQGGYEPGSIIINETKQVDKGDIIKFLDLLKRTNYWDLPTKQKQDENGLDGSQWIIEGLQGGKYHIIDRWSPEKGPARKLGMFFIQLCKVDFKDIY